MKNLRLARAWDDAFDAVVRLNAVALEMFAADDRFADPEAPPFRIEIDLSDEGVKLLKEQLGAPVKRKADEN